MSRDVKSQEKLLKCSVQNSKTLRFQDEIKFWSADAATPTANQIRGIFILVTSTITQLDINSISARKLTSPIAMIVHYLPMQHY